VKVAIIGAGIAGLACGRALADQRIEATVFDKGRSPGGRLATRRIEAHTFDLGAQYFTVKDERFASVVRAWQGAGVTAPWTGRIVAIDGVGAAPRPVADVERFVGTPGMSAIARQLAIGLDVHSSHRVDRIMRTADRFTLHGTTAEGVTLAPASAADGELLGTFDRVLVCIPANQAGSLLEGVSPRLAAKAHAVPFDPCFAVAMVPGAADEARLRDLPFDGAFIGRDGECALAWAARDSSKPGRPEGNRWVLHATPSWSRRWLQAPEAEVGERLVRELADVFGFPPLSPSLTHVRRWSFARATAPLATPAVFDGNLGAAGDWTADGRVEGAFLAGLALGAGE